MAPEMNGWAAAIILMWLSVDKETLADASARGGAIKHGQVFVFQPGRAFQRHRSAAINIGCLNFVLFQKPMAGQHYRRRNRSIAHR